jgi:predicted nucleic acid-binding protein
MPTRYDRRRATVVAFDAPSWDPPAAVVVDTNVAAEALLRRESEHASCDEAFHRMSTAGTLVVFNRLLEVELSEVIFNHAVRSHTARSDIRHTRFLPTVRRAAATIFDEAMRDWQSLLQTWSRAMRGSRCCCRRTRRCTPLSGG